LPRAPEALAFPRLFFSAMRGYGSRALGISVSKPALGRNFGHLMKEAKTSSASSEPATEPASVSPGLATLLRRSNGEGRTPESGPAPGPEPATPPLPFRRRRLLQASLLLADVLLLALAMLCIFKGRAPFGFIGIVLCVIAVALGAWLSCLAFWLE